MADPIDSERADYAWLTGIEAAEWLEELCQSEQPLHRQLNRLGKSLTSERARLVVGQVALRQRAIVKFGRFAAKMYFTDILLQQATDLWTARYKASRVSRGTPVVDYCCGIGGDLLGFAERGPATGWDRDPILAHLANANLQAIQAEAACQACVGNVESLTPMPAEVWHLDPDRRPDGRRSTQIQWHSPDPEVIENWRASSPNGILKLAPAAVVPKSWADDAELEWISRDRQCRQLVVWFGELSQACGQRRATVLQKPTADNEFTDPVSFVGSVNTTASISGSVSRYIYDTDPAIRAAGLTDAVAVEHGLSLLNQGPSYLTGDQAVDHPLLARFEVRDQLPLRRKALIKHLRSLGIGQLEIKSRGVAIDPEQLRKQLRLRGSESATLLLARLGTREIALLARRCEPN